MLTWFFLKYFHLWMQPLRACGGSDGIATVILMLPAHGISSVHPHVHTHCFHATENPLLNPMVSPNLISTPATLTSLLCLACGRHTPTLGLGIGCCYFSLALLPQISTWPAPSLLSSLLQYHLANRACHDYSIYNGCLLPWPPALPSFFTLALSTGFATHHVSWFLVVCVVYLLPENFLRSGIFFWHTES